MDQSNRRERDRGDDQAVVDGGEEPAYPELDGPALLRLSRAGDARAFERITNKYRARLSVIPRRIPDVGVREDILQIVWLKLYEQDPAYFASEQHLINWLCRVAMNLVVSYFRGPAVRREANIPAREDDSEPDILTNLPDPRPSAEYLFLANESALAVWECVQKLQNEEQRQVINLLLRDVAQTEIKKVLGVSDTTVHRLKKRAFRFLRSCLELQGQRERQVGVPRGSV